jgi:hypothetical protein
LKAEAFLARCNKVKTTGHGTWLACCPGHADKRPSMTVRELEDGRVLVHCFSGCDVGQILAAVGMEITDLFPDRDYGPMPRLRPPRRAFPAADVLEAIANEMRVACLIASSMHQGQSISKEDYARLWLAMERIETAREIANGPSSPQPRGNGKAGNGRY